MFQNIDKILDTLQQQGKVSKRDLKQAKKEAAKIEKSPITILQQNGVIDNTTLGEALATIYNLEYLNIEENLPVRETVLKLDQEYAETFRVILVSFDDKSAILTTDTPDDPMLLSTLEEVLNDKEIVLSYSLPSEIDRLINFYINRLDTKFLEIVKKDENDSTNIFNAILEDALELDVSDIHFEPRQGIVIVRFRVDGILREAGRISDIAYESLLNLIKVKNGLRTDIHLKPQDGSMRVKKGKIRYDIRTSLVPTIQGEKAVLRLLASYVKVLGLKDIGLTPDYQTLLEQAAKKPYGICIISGPTGSGKTTTLYSLLKSTNRYGSNVTTIEDPVEYRIPGVNQIQVNQDADLTFNSALRSVVRQDPDVILLGEIRDKESAEIAINAALTGILIFTTFHAGDSAITIPRLIDMGIEPFILASSLELIMSQRLLRVICEECKTKKVVSRKSLEKIITKPNRFFKSDKVTLYYGKGCPTCNDTGFDGRTAIYEHINIDTEMRDLIITRPSGQDIWKLARKNGAISLFEDGLVKVNEGVTTLEELMRVAQPQEI